MIKQLQISACLSQNSQKYQIGIFVRQQNIPIDHKFAAPMIEAAFPSPAHAISGIIPCLPP